MSAVPTSVPHLYRESFLRSLGLIGMESIEPIVIAGPKLWASTPGYFARR